MSEKEEKNPIEKLQEQLRTEFKDRIDKMLSDIKGLPERIERESREIIAQIDERLDILKQIPVPSVEWLVKENAKWSISKPVEISRSGEVSVSSSSGGPVNFLEGSWNAAFTLDQGNWRIFIMAIPIKKSLPDES